MNRTIAGVLDPRGRDAEANVSAALAETPSIHVRTLGPLTLGWTGGDGPTVAAGPFAVLDGWLYYGGPADVAGERELARAVCADPSAALAPLRGDFSLVAWDPSRGAGVLARDHMGGRSLYWHASGERICFASDVRYLLRLLTTRPAPDETAVAHWIGIHAPPGELTLYGGVRRLEPGSFLTIGSGPARARRYWSPIYREPLRADRADLALRLRSELTRATDRRLRGATTGILLSGGLDSSAVAATAVRAPEPPIRSYSATFPEHPEVDESDLIEGLTHDLDLANTTLRVSSGSVLAGALPYLEQWELPPTSPNLFFWLPLFERAASDGVLALLDGEGGDELFGASAYLLADNLMHGRPGSAWDLTSRIPGAGSRPPRAWRWQVLREFGLKGAVPKRAHALAWRRRDPRAYAVPWLRRDLAEGFVAGAGFADWKDAGVPRWWAWLRYVMTRHPGPMALFEHSRRRAALRGLEPRHPLFDVDLIELVLRLPPEAAFDPVLTRPLFREAMADWLPDRVRLRPGKSSFDAVFHEAMSGRDRAAIGELLDPASAEVGAYVDLDVVRRELLEPGPPTDLRGRQAWAIGLWRLVTMECWLKLQVDPDMPRWTVSAATFPKRSLSR